MESQVEIVVAGPKHAGKTSLIKALLTESFEASVPAVLPKVTIPSKYNPENVKVTITDTNGDHFDAQAVAAADVVVLVYAVDSPSFDADVPLWLSQIAGANPTAPVILVGSKIDVRGQDVTNFGLEDALVPIMNQFKQVETCIEASSLLMINVAEVFYFALKSFLYPTSLLYDSASQTLQPAFVRALRRIFFLADRDHDGHLSDAEMVRFQDAVFKQQLSADELASIKECIASGSEDGFIYGRGITEAGFVFLNLLFIQRGRLETSWTILKHFGYDQHLQLHVDVSAVKVDQGVVAQLSEQAVAFLASLFSKFDKNGDGFLSAAEMQAFSRLLPLDSYSAYFPSDDDTDADSLLHVQSFLAFWHAVAFINPHQALLLLKHFGFPDDHKGLAFVAHTKRSQRTTFRCLVAGSADSGRASLLSSFLRKRHLGKTVAGVVSGNKVVACGQYKGGEKYMLFDEMDERDDGQAPDLPKDRHIDLLCLVANMANEDSLDYIKGLWERNGHVKALPTVVVATNCAQDWLPGTHRLESYCKQQSISHCIFRSDNEDYILDSLIHAAVEPYPLLVSDPRQTVCPSLRERMKRRTRLQVGTVAGISAALVLGAFYVYRQRSRPHQ